MTLIRLLAPFAFATLAALPAAAFDMTQMTDADREAFRAEIRAYLLENPEVLMEAIEALKVKQAAEQANADEALVASYSEQLFNDPNSWVGGNPDGDIVLVEFMDYRCGYCRKAHDEVADLIATDGNIRFVVKEFPILGEQSTLSSRFAIAVRQVAGDEAYKNAYETLISMKAEANAESLSRVADDLGLDATEVFAQMESPEVQAIIDANHQLGSLMQINGTPTFVLGNQLIRGYVPQSSMMAIVAQERG